MRVGYIRTSKRDQNPDMQRRDLLAAGCEKVFQEQISSRKADRPVLRAALEYVREGDALVVWKLDRFGRSLKELIEHSSTQTFFVREASALCSGFVASKPLRSMAPHDWFFLRKETMAQARQTVISCL